MMVTLISSSESSEVFYVTTVLFFILAPVLFFTSFSLMLQYAFRHSHGIKFQFRTETVLNMKGQSYRQKKKKRPRIMFYKQLEHAHATSRELRILEDS